MIIDTNDNVPFILEIKGTPFEQYQSMIQKRMKPSVSLLIFVYVCQFFTKGRRGQA